MFAKRIFIGSSIFFVFLLVLWGVYTLLFRAPDTQMETPELPEQEKSGETSAMRSSGIEPVITSPLTAPGLSGDGNILYFIDKSTGHIYSKNITTGEKELLVEYNLPGVLAAAWPGRGTQVIVKAQGLYTPAFWLYDVRANEPIRLKDGIRYVVWDALSDRIIYSYVNADETTSLTVADSNGANWKNVSILPSDTVKLAVVPQSPLVSFWNPPLNTRISSLTTVNVASGEQKVIFDGKYGADYLWSPRGDKALISWAPEKNGSKLALATINANGGGYADLNFPTMVSKCVWAKDAVTVYCAHPGTFPSGTVLPEDYSRRYVYTKDSFWKINTQTGETERIIPLESIDKEYDATNLFLNGNESKLFFVNRKDDMLYSIEL